MNDEFTRREKIIGCLNMLVVFFLLSLICTGLAYLTSNIDWKIFNIFASP